MMRPMRVLSYLMGMAAISSTVTAKPRIYRNPEFGIVLPVPDAALPCPAHKNEHDHGPTMLLGAADTRGCRDLEHHRSIEVFASYNVVERTKELPGFLNDQCVGVDGGPCQPAPNGLQMTGRPSAAASVNRPDGWTVIVVVTQAGAPDPGIDGNVPSVNYGLVLHTTSDHMEQDLRVFRTVLQTIRLSPPPPPEESQKP